MAQFASGTFTGAAGTELTAHDANWINRTRNGAQNCVLDNANRLRGPIDACEYYHSGTPASADYSVEADFTPVTILASTSASLYVRATTTYSNGYAATVMAGVGLRLYKQSGGGFSTLVTYTFTPAAGVTNHVKVIVSGSSTTVIKVELDGVERINYSDSSSPHTSAGKVAVRFANLGATSNDTTLWRIDNFSADDPAGAVTGTLAKTNANDTLAASGSVGSVTGTLAKTNANDTLAATGSTPVVGTLAKTNANDTVSASGTSGSTLLDITAQATPIYIGHAGNKQLYPEESHTGFAASVASGANILDFDVWPLSGGAVLGVMHDSDVDRTTSGTGLISNKSEAQWNALTLDPSTYLGGNYPDTEAPPLFADVLSNHISDAMFSVECKPTTAGPMTVLLAALGSAGVGSNQALVSSFTSSHIATINTAGYESMFLTGSGGESAATILGYGAGWVGPGTGTSNAQITNYLAAGLKVVPWTINRRFTRDIYTAANPTITGFFSDDAKYLGSATALRTSDNFASQTWDNGMYASDDAMTSASRGEFFASDYWGYSSNETTYRSCLMGFLSPVASPSNFTLDLKITFTSANASDDSYYADVVIGTTDNGFANTASGLIGYVFRFHKNGTVAVYLKAWLASPVLKSSTAGSAIADGVEKNFRITVTSGVVKAAQIDGSGADITAASWTDASSRGGYVTLGRAGLAAKFRDISVADSSAITGSLAKTNANDTVVASGTTTVTGSVAKTNANDTAAASGSTTVVGSLAKTNASDTLAGSGSVGSAVSGTVSHTNANDTAAATGTTTVIGSLARTNANDSLSASGSVGSAVSGTLARTNANDTCTASGSTTVTGALAKTNANDTLAATGSVASAVTGALSCTNANDTLAASGSTPVTGSLAKTNANDTIAASGISGNAVPITSAVTRRAKFHVIKTASARIN